MKNITAHAAYKNRANKKTKTTVISCDIFLIFGFYFLQ